MELLQIIGPLPSVLRGSSYSWCFVCYIHDVFSCIMILICSRVCLAVQHEDSGYWRSWIHWLSPCGQVDGKWKERGKHIFSYIFYFLCCKVMEKCMEALPRCSFLSYWIFLLQTLFNTFLCSFYSGDCCW